MDVYIYQENTRKIKGEEVTVLMPIGVLEDFESEDAALEALLDAEPDFMGVELVLFTQEPQYITAEEPTTKYAFKRRNGATVEEDEEEQDEEPDEEEPEAEEEEQEEEAPVRRRRPAAKKGAARSKPAAKKSSGRQRPASKAATRTGNGRRSPFTRNAKSAE